MPVTETDDTSGFQRHDARGQQRQQPVPSGQAAAMADNARRMRTATSCLVGRTPIGVLSFPYTSVGPRTVIRTGSCPEAATGRGDANATAPDCHGS